MKIRISNFAILAFALYSIIAQNSNASVDNCISSARNYQSSWSVYNPQKDDAFAAIYVNKILADQDYDKCCTSRGSEDSTSCKDFKTEYIDNFREHPLHPCNQYPQESFCSGTGGSFSEAEKLASPSATSTPEKKAETEALWNTYRTQNNNIDFSSAEAPNTVVVGDKTRDKNQQHEVLIIKNSKKIDVDTPEIQQIAIDVPKVETKQIVGKDITDNQKKSKQTHDIQVLKDASKITIDTPIIQPVEVNVLNTDEDLTDETTASVSNTSTGQDNPFVDSSCKSQIDNFFASEENKDLKEEYMKTQGKITLHRIAWTYLKLADSPTDSIEEEIKNLIIQRNPDLHKDFIETEFKTRNERLEHAIRQLQMESQRLAKEGEDVNQAYALQYSDIKMMNLLAEAEELNGRKFTDGVMDFTSIIDNSLRGKFDSKDKNIDKFEETIDQLTNKKNEFEEKLLEYLESVDCSEIRDNATCEVKQLDSTSISQILQVSRDIIDKVYLEDFGKKEELKNVYQWNNYWLHVVK